MCVHPFTLLAAVLYGYYVIGRKPHGRHRLGQVGELKEPFK